MRTLLIGVLLTVFLLPATALAERSPPANLKQLGERLDQLAKRIDFLIQEAMKDPDERKIDIYNAYTAEELKLKRRKVRVLDLLGYMVDSTKNFNVRVKAQEAIWQGGYARGDPDLSLTDKQGRKSKRAYFCDKHVIKHLRDEDDKATRKLVHELLLKMWRVNNVPQIAGYNVNDKKTWAAAWKAWGRYLDRN